MVASDRDNKTVPTAPYIDEHGEEVIAPRVFRYDTHIISIVSLTNDFGTTPGVKEQAIALETPQQTALFHRCVVNACVRAYAPQEPLRPG